MPRQSHESSSPPGMPVQMRVSRNYGYLSGGLHNEDYSNFGLIGVPLFWEITKCDLSVNPFRH